MEYRKLGASGLKVSAIGLGSWLTFGSRLAKEDVRKITRRALELGVNFIDTADVYERGLVESNLGYALEGVERSSYVLATKCYWPMSDDANDQGLSRKHVHESCAKSLKRLKTDYVDLYQAHRYDPEVPLEEVVLAMSDLVERGMALYWGVSCWSAAQITDAVRLAERLGARKPISNQPPYSMLDRDVELELETDRAVGVGQVVFSPLAQGVLTGKYTGGGRPKESRGADTQRSRLMQKHLADANIARAERVAAIARELGKTPAQLALAWILRRPEVAAPIVGATRAEQLEENVKANDMKLDAETLAAIEAALGNAPEPRQFI
jgi:voltage-dependent potassium channel beta subunit